MGSKRKSTGGSEKSSKSSKTAASTKSSAGDISISIDTSKANVQPVLAKFSAAVPAVASSFATYKSVDSNKKDACLVVNETEKIEFVGQNYEDGKKLNSGSRYLVGVYDKETDTVTFRAAPLVNVNTVIKSLKSARGVLDRNISNAVIQARNELGEAFGNKKRKAQIRSEERNKINMDTVKGDMGIIEASIEKRISTMPSEKDLAAEANVSRPLPKFDSEAKTPEAIYDMEDVLPKALQSHIDILPFIKNTDAEGYKPFIAARSQFIYKKIERILGVTKPDTVELRRTIYLNYLMRFYGMQNKFLRNRAECIKSLSCSPEIADAIFDIFTDCDAGSHNQDGSPVFVKTTATENKLACYIAVLMLSLNKWTAYPLELAADLNIPGKKAETYFQNVGCKLEAASAADIAANTYSKRPRSGGNKIAILKAPVQFPKASLRGSK